VRSFSTTPAKEFRCPLARTAPVRDGRHQALAVLIGKWINEGHTIGTSEIPSAPILTSDVYEWAPGGFFVVHSAFGKIGQASVGGVEIIGVDGEAYCSTGAHHIRTGPKLGRDACVGVCGLYLAFCAVWAGARTAGLRMRGRWTRPVAGIFRSALTGASVVSGWAN
jgi:hypothetical protein